MMQTTLFSYDDNGNILNKKSYMFTTSDNFDMDMPGISFKYASDGVKDNLVGIDLAGAEEAVTYEAGSLNPSLYRSYNMQWEKGGQLKQMSNAGIIASFTYDDNGFRSEKRVHREIEGTEITKYLYNNGKIIREERNNYVIRYIYGSNGIIGFKEKNKLDGTEKEYLYYKNLQGDITHIIDSEGRIVVEYAYNAWGQYMMLNCLDFELAERNSILYRGYYFDRETGLYYLNSRYYDPETFRFINADDTDVFNYTASILNGLNLYAYCFNNPISYLDSTGKIPLTNTFFEAYYKEKILGFDNKFWGRLSYSTKLLSFQTAEKGFLYAYSDLNVGNGNKSWGIGLNAWDWFGFDIGVDSGGNLFGGMSFTPWLHWSGSIGLDGITLNLGFTINGKSHDFSIGIGLAPIAIIVGIAASIFSYGQASNPVFGFLGKIFGF